MMHRCKFLRFLRDTEFSITQLKEMETQANTRFNTREALLQNPAATAGTKLQQQVAGFLTQTNQEILLINRLINYVEKNPPAGQIIHELGLEIIIDLV
ncbi:unnamed protein product [Adineta steineri]|uniref:Uncharacterized protein n=1 Tax=Adineta steineri TaxID=433720 RepID=A0A819LZU7_9BILA|nr:unnamed protein product [Adineta steineri]CAF1397190.1 unnamed protein product [Adineta steineri]CAF1412702.1 unnamed protein product [Adineta steineri]CAF3545477.1 unnamed protein product [Adineta steineri]CAF3970545.1 unnamed protein product [Adineta steineri]